MHTRERDKIVNHMHPHVLATSAWSELENQLLLVVWQIHFPAIMPDHRALMLESPCGLHALPLRGV